MVFIGADIFSSRDECPNMNWFMSLENIRDKRKHYRRNYNECRPRSTQTYWTPSDLVLKTGSKAV
jgi:hypothetical protein